MAFYGKIFAVDKEDNYDAFIKSFGLPEDKVKGFQNSKPKQKFDKNGDEFSLTYYLPNGMEKIFKFKSGVEFEDEIRGNAAKLTITVNGNNVIQVVKFDIGFTVTIKREYSNDKLTEEISRNGWNGVAYRYYKTE